MKPRLKVNQRRNLGDSLEEDKMPEAKTMPKDNVWVQTTCDMCNGMCGMFVHRVDGVAVDIKGDPDSPLSRGKLCAKAYAAIMGLYDPYRVKTPLKRTNPEKGIGIDPGWVRISWDEALDMLVRELTKVDDPSKLMMATYDPRHFVFDQAVWSQAFAAALAARSHGSGRVGHFGTIICGASFHSGAHMAHGTHRTETDPDHLDYQIMLGRNFGFGTGHTFTHAAQKTAEARKRGMKLVVVDPLCNNAAAKADEWLPIRPGTDGALVLSMINVLLNEVGIYDREFIKKYTNGPYLVKPDGTYLRREDKPMVWDAGEGIAKTYDAEVKDYAIEAPEGCLWVDGVECFPAFHLLKEHVKKYTPEMASEITTIPAATIRRIAEEFGRAARIGSTIVIDGVELPYRPAVINQFRGAHTHRHGTHVGLAVLIMNQIVGSYYVPGGLQGLHLVGPSWSWEPGQTDGLMMPQVAETEQEFYDFEVKAPEPTSYNMKELFPFGAPQVPLRLMEPEKYGVPLALPEVLLVNRRNLFVSGFDHKKTKEAMKKVRFIVAFRTHLDEVSEMADLFLPDTNSLEECDCGSRILGSVINDGGGDKGAPVSSPMTDHWFWALRKPVVPPLGECRHWVDVLMEVAERMGFLKEVYRVVNKKLKEPHKLDISKKYSTEEINDRRTKSLFGEDKGLKWFKENGWLNIKMKVEERYPLPWLKVRFPLYYENFLRARGMIETVTQELEFRDWDVSDYEALINWRPCSAFEEKGDEFDLIAINFRLPTHSFSWTAENAWLSELAQFNPYAQKIIINTETAKRKGIKDNDKIYVESKVAKVVGVAKVTDCVHPETVGISGHFGSLSKGTPVAYGKGTNFNSLLPGEIETLSSGVDSCVRVKVYKA